MSRFAAGLALAVPLLISASAPSNAVAFKCEYAVTKVEAFACRIPKLRACDEKVFKLVGGLIASLKTPAERDRALTEQLQYQNQFEKCGENAVCLFETCRPRVVELETQLMKATSGGTK